MAPKPTLWNAPARLVPWIRPIVQRVSPPPIEALGGSTYTNVIPAGSTINFSAAIFGLNDQLKAQVPPPTSKRVRHTHAEDTSPGPRVITPDVSDLPFELDGNATTQATHDWDQVYNDAVLNPGQNTSGSIPGTATFLHDPVNSGTDDSFSGEPPGSAVEASPPKAPLQAVSEKNNSPKDTRRMVDCPKVASGAWLARILVQNEKEVARA